MNTLRAVLVFVVGMFLADSVFAKRDDPFIFLNEDEVLQVEFHYSADAGLYFSAPSVADEMERTAQVEFRDALDAVLEGANLPVAVELLGPLDRAEKGLPVLSVQSLRWKPDRSGGIEAVINVNLELDGYKNKLGSFRATEGMFAFPTQDQTRAARVKVMKEVLSKMLFELNSHFKLPGE